MSLDHTQFPPETQERLAALRTKIEVADPNPEGIESVRTNFSPHQLTQAFHGLRDLQIDVAQKIQIDPETSVDTSFDPPQYRRRLVDDATSILITLNPFGVAGRLLIDERLENSFDSEFSGSTTTLDNLGLRVCQWGTNDNLIEATKIHDINISDPHINKVHFDTLGVLATRKAVLEGYLAQELETPTTSMQQAKFPAKLLEMAQSVSRNLARRIKGFITISS